MFVQTYSYDYVTVLTTKKRLRECSLDISLPIDTKTSHMHAHPSSIQRSKGCDVYIRGRESLTKSTQDFEFSISTDGQRGQETSTAGVHQMRPFCRHSFIIIIIIIDVILLLLVISSLSNLKNCDFRRSKMTWDHLTDWPTDRRTDRRTDGRTDGHDLL